MPLSMPQSTCGSSELFTYGNRLTSVRIQGLESTNTRPKASQRRAALPGKDPGAGRAGQAAYLPKVREPRKTPWTTVMFNPKRGVVKNDGPVLDPGAACRPSKGYRKGPLILTTTQKAKCEDLELQAVTRPVEQELEMLLGVHFMFSREFTNRMRTG